MTVGTASTEIVAPEFVPQEPSERPESNDPFTINEDGTVDLDLSGKARIRGELLRVDGRLDVLGNAIVDGDLIVQDVDILQEIQNIQANINSINTLLQSMGS